MKKIGLSKGQFTIKNPQENCTYYLPYDDTPGKVKIKFPGIMEKKIAYVDVSALISATVSSHEKRMWYAGNSIILFRRDNLPYSLKKKTKSPILAKIIRDGRCEVAEIEKLIYYDLGAESKPRIKGKIIDLFPFINEELERTYKNKFNIPIFCGSFPIFCEDNRPTYEFIASLYKQFMLANDKSKLEHQYKESINYCHIRAHFISVFLQKYLNIPTMKIYKCWNPEDWRKFVNNKSWTFHAATLIMDNKSRLWVWDPWVGNILTLLTMEQWLHRKNEPLPIKAMICSPYVINDVRKGRIPDGFTFNGPLGDNDYWAVFQAISSSVIPNAPKPPIPSNHQVVERLKACGLFSAPVKTLPDKLSLVAQKVASP